MLHKMANITDGSHYGKSQKANYECMKQDRDLEQKPEHHKIWVNLQLEDIVGHRVGSKR